MGYQYVQNFKNARHLVIREYEEADLSRVPDEQFEIVLKYYDARQIQEEKVAYSTQLYEFRREVMRLWDVAEEVYLEERERNNRQDWDLLLDATIYRDRPSKQRGWFRGDGSANGDEGEQERAWNEITFVHRKLTTLESMNQTYEQEIQEYKVRLTRIRERLKETFGIQFPDHRLALEQRLNFLENQFLEFMARVNPYHVQPGLLLEMTLTSIKRKRITILGMSNLLNEFLLQVSKGFTDISISHFEKRRSHVGGVDDTFLSSSP
ncbi:MAG: hypothetical protein IIA14_06685 [SAR324 cluster bacterium]|nr:hypothetical protein [SAR324 cluster bacterium]